MIANTFCLFALVTAAMPAAAQSVASVEQVGALNRADLLQSARSEAMVSQLGAGGHIVRLEQHGDAYADILQQGGGNVLGGFDALGNPDVLAAALSIDASRLVLSQIGNGNHAFVQQDAGAIAHIIQDGTTNRVLIRQGSGSFP